MISLSTIHWWLGVTDAFLPSELGKELWFEVLGCHVCEWLADQATLKKHYDNRCDK